MTDRSDEHDPLDHKLRVGLAAQAGEVAPRADVADLTDRIAARGRRSQALLSVAAVLLLVFGVAAGVAVGRNTASRPDRTATAGQGTGGNDRASAGMAPLANGGTRDFAAPGPGAAGPLTHLFTRTTADGITLRVYVPQAAPSTGVTPDVGACGTSSAVHSCPTSPPATAACPADAKCAVPGVARGCVTGGSPCSPPATRNQPAIGSGTSSGSPAACGTWSQEVVVEASSGDVAGSQTLFLGGPAATTGQAKVRGEGFAATSAVMGVAEGHPFVVVVAGDSHSFDGAGVALRATGGAKFVSDSTASSTAVGTNGVTAFAVPLPAGSTALPSAITVNVPQGPKGSTNTIDIFQALSLTNEQPSASLGVPPGGCTPTSPTTMSYSECSKLKAQGHDIACPVPSTTIPTACPDSGTSNGTSGTVAPNGGASSSGSVSSNGGATSSGSGSSGGGPSGASTADPSCPVICPSVNPGGPDVTAKPGAVEPQSTPSGSSGGASTGIEVTCSNCAAVGSSTAGGAATGLPCPSTGASGGSPGSVGGAPPPAAVPPAKPAN